MERLNRIREMERCFDLVLSAKERGDGSFRNDPLVREAAERLARYYGSGQWRTDYESDERGELPASLKRGVLSEDGIWNLLYE